MTKEEMDFVVDIRRDYRGDICEYPKFFFSFLGFYYSKTLTKLNKAYK